MTGILAQSFEVMLVGMGFVFIFLAILVAATTLMSRVVTTYFPEPQPQAKPSTPPPASAPAAVDPTTLAVLSAAIQKHRSKRK